MAEVRQEQKFRGYICSYKWLCITDNTSKVFSVSRISRFDIYGNPSEKLQKALDVTVDLLFKSSYFHDTEPNMYKGIILMTNGCTSRELL